MYWLAVIVGFVFLRFRERRGAKKTAGGVEGGNAATVAGNAKVDRKTSDEASSEGGSNDEKKGLGAQRTVGEVTPAAA